MPESLLSFVDIGCLVAAITVIASRKEVNIILGFSAFSIFAGAACQAPIGLIITIAYIPLSVLILPHQHTRSTSFSGR